MKRPALNNRLEEEVSDCFSTSAPNSSHTHPEETSSPYFQNNYHMSDSESLSDGSSKNRRKRNTYQKISDEIRVGLLDAVKNGETLKSAAKRYKINYSSAKSILHTYRKEGRILKKSAQERTAIKKKNSISMSSVSSEPHMPHKMVKRESSKADGSYSTISQSLASIPEEMKPEMAHTMQGENRKGSNDNMPGLFHHPVKFENNHLVFHEEGAHDGREEEFHQNQRMFDNFSHNFGNCNFMDSHVKIDGMFPTMPQYQNFSLFSNDTDSYNDVDTKWHTKSSLPEDLSTDPNAFFCAKGVDERIGRFENEMVFQDYNDRNYPLRTFLDSQHFLKEALKSGSSMMYNDGPTVRKSSIDFF